MKIGVFDSGVGGLTVLKELLIEIDSADFIYYGDSFNSPYGTKNIEVVKDFCYNITKFLISKNVDLIVVACNTATIASLDYLKYSFPSLPIIGVITPGAIMALKESKNKKIGVLSTPLTAKMNAYKDIIQKMNKNYEVFQQGCELLCPMIERGWLDNNESQSILKNYINKLPKDIDTLILGCTHYPYLENKIKEITQCTIINPAKETAKLVSNEIQKFKNNSIKKDEIKISYYVTGDIQNFITVGEQLLNKKITNVYSI